MFYLHFDQRLKLNKIIIPTCPSIDINLQQSFSPTPCENETKDTPHPISLCGELHQLNKK